VKNVTKKFKYT